MKRLMWFTLCLFLLTDPLWAAISYDATSGQSSEGTTSTTHNVTIAADANILIVCLAIRESGGAVAAATGVTVGGAAATFLSGATNAGNVIRAEMWYKLAPATGTVSVVASYNASTDLAITGGMAFKGVAQSSTFGTPVTAVSSATTNIDVDAIGSAVGEMGVLCGAVRDNGSAQTTVSADGTAPVSTERYEDPHGAGLPSITGFGYTEDGAATSINMRVDANNTAQWAAVGVSMRPSATTRRASQPIQFQ
jgi:hypothetical protein